MGGAQFDRCLEVSAHAHAQVLKIIAPCDGGQKFKMLVWHVIDGRNAHEARNLQTIFGPAIIDKAIRTGNADPSLLLFITRIDLNEKLQLPRLPCHFRANRLGNARPINSMDGIKQTDCVRRFVALQRTN